MPRLSALLTALLGLWRTWTLRGWLALHRGQPRDRGGVSLEWMVVTGILFMVAVAASAKYSTTVRGYMNKIK